MILNGLPKSTKRNVAPVTSSRVDLPLEMFSLASTMGYMRILVCQCVLCLPDIFYQWMTVDTKQTTATRCWYKVLQPIVIMMLIMFSSFSFEVWSSDHVLWNMAEHIRIRSKHIPHAVHICSYRIPNKDGSILLHPEDWQKAWRDGSPALNRRLSPHQLICSAG